MDGSIEVAGVDGTWQSDDLIQEPQKQRLMDGVKAVEKAQLKMKECHPGSNNQMWALIDPNLFSFVKGRTPVLKEELPSDSSNTIMTPEISLLNYSTDETHFMSQEEISQMITDNTRHFPELFISKKFQWLPSEFKVDETGSVKITSYINNLHPVIHSDLYRSIEEVFQKFVPLFNKVLTDMRNPQDDRVILQKIKPLNEGPVGYKSSIPSVLQSKVPRTIVNLQGRELQVIVKLTQLQLTPENPEYSGGPWQVAGMVNERIVATGIYYYSLQNITESRLMFRQSIRRFKLQSDGYFESIYGLRKNESLMNQNVGSIVTKQGRCIAFPNTLQHQAAPFKLENLTLPGHQKILVFHLVDPSIRILSTARVPPQQKSWFIQEIFREPGSVILPEEIVYNIIGMLESSGITLKEAKKYMEELMQERILFVKIFNDVFESKFRRFTTPQITIRTHIVQNHIQNL